VLTGPLVILILKVAVAAVTVLLLASLVALARGNRTLHGRINVVFAALTLAAVLGLEVLIRFIDPELFTYFDPPTLAALRVHLCFAVPSAVLLPVMLYTGLTRRRNVHIGLAVLFSLLWTGTVVTGIFFLPHR
jgi:hypothetical protein